jgi:hypothetical protein
MVMWQDTNKFSATYPFLNDLPKDRVTVLDFSHNYARVEGLTQLSSQFDQLKIPHVIFGSDSVASPTDTVCHFPTFYLYGLVHWIKDYKCNFTSEKIYNISCLNNGPHTHRIHNYVRLHEQNYERTMLSWRRAPVPGNESWEYPLEDSVVAKFNQLLENANILAPREPMTFKDLHSINHVAYRNSYINIITETRVINDVILLTEKTWKPIASGQLFFLIGCQNSIAYLRNLGVDVFDDIIDHSYDSDPDPARRVDLMHVSLAKLMQQDLADIYNLTQDRRHRNQELYFSGRFGLQYVDHINSLIQGKTS